MWVGLLEGENTLWEFLERGTAGTIDGSYLVYNSRDYKHIDYYSGSGVALLLADTVGTPGNGDGYQFGNTGLFSTLYHKLPSPTSGSYRYNVYAYIFPHTSCGNWRVQIRENGVLTTSLLEKDISGYSSINRGRTQVALGQIILNQGVEGVAIEMTAINAGAGGGANMFFDALAFVRAP